jgi:hypothetical protein
LTRHALVVCLALALAPALAPLPARAVTADDVLAEAAAFCASFENGTITVGPDVVQPVDLTGDGTPETVIDYKGIACSTLASAWGGTGGTTLSILIDGQRFDHLAYGWKVVDFDGPVLLLSQHGVNCGATGSDRCVQALVWTAGKLTGPGEAAATEEAAPAAD